MHDRRGRMLALLADREWHGRDAMIDAAGHRFATVIHELRGEGYAIETEQVRAGWYRYRLTGTPGEDVRVVMVQRADKQALLDLEPEA